MSKFFNLSLALVSILSLSILSQDVSAQQYRGSYPGDKDGRKYVDLAARPVPKVFSSQITSVQEAQKIDALYNNLYVSLWNYALTDFNYQKRLYDLLEFERFQITRYSKEFTGDMKDSMDNLNQNYKNMLYDIDVANEKYVVIKEGIRAEDYEILDSLWQEKIETFKSDAKEYFKMQHAFLKTYKGLVEYIIEQGGSYYYDSVEGSIRFYKNSGQQFFGKSIDKLRRITYQQKKMLKEKAPANVDVETIQ